MFPDDFDVEPFNPFNVGPPNSGARSEFKIPTCVTYPPPVFVAKSEYLQPSKDSLARKSNQSIGQSRSGEVDISKAINEEMAVAKKQAAALNEKDRIDAGGVSKTKLSRDSQSKEALSKDSLRTLMPVRSPTDQQFSGEGRTNSKLSISESSAASKTSCTYKQSQAYMASKSSNITLKRSAIANSISSNTTLTPKSVLKSANYTEAAKVSATSMKSKVSNKPSETGTQRSLNLKPASSESKQSLESVQPKQSDFKMQESEKRILQDSQKKTLQESQKKTLQDLQKRTSPEQLPSDIVTKKAQQDSWNDRAHSRTNKSSVLPESKDGPSYIRSEAALSYRQSLNQQAAEMADRLNAGNENFRRYNSVARNHSIKVPQRLCDGDRMTFWFSDAVLS
ncbi:uncharacterized protein LOC122625949 [Drosophila teissieri]|uniref:uncharacterized protein LOC122625949 n=1 Tax=Drosophila teissieri TaxID=7243 RepID=UPI001CBA27C6|nr:uncharacterized protein LOC122625949 [Drosophila teissieri]XP_043661954.1 uncharacterized protein LOC122625949 [Drosophila teissieri]